MAENYYEGMFLLDSGKFASDHDKVTGHVVNILEKAGGTVVAHRPWQEGRLAYAVEGHRKGVHYLSYFRMQPEGLKDVARACKLSDVVLRHLVIKQPDSLFGAMVDALSGHEVQASQVGEVERRPPRERAETQKTEDTEEDGDEDDET